MVIGSVSVDSHRPRTFTSTGMSWEDLVIAMAVYEPNLIPLSAGKVTFVFLVGTATQGSHGRGPIVMG
ncbi:hypothetical protein RCH23_001758 [Cryobacterium sp. CAN_C3]|nr:hypothetical protein [Cryobacterium sp. CAN_C3]